MNAILAVLVAGVAAGSLVALTIVLTHGRADPLDPQTEIRWLVRWLEHRPRAMAWARRRLDRTTATGFLLTASFVTLLATAVLVGALFEMFTRNALIARWDLGVANWGATNVNADNRDILVRVTDLGSTLVVMVVLALVGAFELIRRRWASAAFLVAVVGGQLLVNNALKLIVGRERPDIARLVGISGSSFPSGHTVAAAATWSAVALVLSRDSTRRGRAFAAGVAAGIAGAVAATRALLGAHWLTDVLAGLAVGWGWFTLVAVLFGGRRQRAAVPVEQAAHEALPAAPHPAPEHATREAPELVAPVPNRRRAAVAAAARTLLGALAVFVAVGCAIGFALSRWLDHTAVLRGDESISEWFVRHRTDTWNDVTHVLSMMGNTETVVLVGLVAVVAMRLVLHRWNEAMVIVMGLGLEVASFLALGNLVGRDRPAVERLDPAPPTSSFPSGHTAAATVLYLGIAWVLLLHLTQRAGRAAVGALAVSFPAAVAVGRIYRGMHHLTDVVAGAALGVACLAIAVRVAMRSNAGADGGAAPAEDAVTRRVTAPPRSRHHPAGAAGAT